MSGGFAPDRDLIAAILLRAFQDAVYTGGSRRRNAHTNVFHQAAADSWIRDCGPVFRKYCHLLGFDPEALAQRYARGEIDAEALRANPLRVARGFGSAPRAARGEMILARRERIRRLIIGEGRTQIDAVSVLQAEGYPASRATVCVEVKAIRAEDAAALAGAGASS